CVLRGDTVTHTKHAGKRVFGAGINLTHLYQGKIRFLWYLIRDLGFVNKFYRGLALPGVHPEEGSIEKPWVAAVERFAIGGDCQILLTMDYVLAAQDAHMTLPAGKEGIITRALLTGWGVVSAAGNRRALRSGEEPLDAFRRYMAVYAREQAVCHYSPALIANLEKHWDAANRRA